MSRSADANTEAPEHDPAVRVLFDGSCPLCRREIAVYRRLRARQRIEWCDVSAPDAPLPPGLDRDAAMARFHVEARQGEIVSGAAAFVALWEALPGWRWLARFARIPGVLQVMEVAYRAFLPLRPFLQRIVPRGP